MDFGNIHTNIIKNGLVFNMDAANRASTIPSISTLKTFNTVDLSQSGSIITDATWTNSTISPAFNFDGSDGYIDTNISLNGIDAISYSTWIKPQAPPGSYGYILAAGNYNPGVERLLQIGVQTSNRKIIAYGGQGGIFESNFVVTYGTWYHVAIVYTNNQDVDFYVNGNAEGSITFSGTLSIAAGSPTRIGVYSGTLSNYFNGNIGPVQIYNRALSANEVLHNYNALKSRFGL